jgi:hypothetical protein
MTGMSERDILGLAASAGRSGLAAAEGTRLHLVQRLVVHSAAN